MKTNKIKLLLVLLSVSIIFGLMGAASFAKDKKKVEPPTYLGKWLRLATYTNGELMHKEPATLTMKKGSFHSINKYCEVN